MKNRNYYFVAAVILLILLIPFIYFNPISNLNESASDEERVENTNKTKPIDLSNMVPRSELDQKMQSGWYLVWNDEFGNNNVIEDRYWTLQTGGGIWGNNELQNYSDRPENCCVEDGKLIIKGRKEDYQNYQFTSARITTKEKIDFLYGKIEVKAKFPRGKGLFPAIWLLPCDDNYVGRKRNGELDLVEILGNDPTTIYGVAHYSLENQNRSFVKYSCDSTDFSKDFHVYSIEWSPQDIKWFVDDNVYFTLDLDSTFDNTYNPFNKKFYLIMNLAIGGDWPGNDFDNTGFPSLFEIEYVRYYKPVN
ncbi:MAG TPA: glycoside hydrolase family 16 protein [Anaerovoracaceae bacterium]|nr:glycoside hydrolase family 16 protein [Anaerovoracaceae bacterium]